MPRTNRGGVRSGTPGKTYSQRTDLNAAPTQPVQVAPSKEYGQGVQQAAAQAAIPLPGPGAGAPPAPPSPQAQGPLPGEIGSLHAPSERPDEHVSTGLPVGPGAGREALNPYMGDDTGAQLRALYTKFPNQDLADLIRVFEANRG